MFEKNSHSHARKIFNLIAPIYSALDKYVRMSYRRAFRSISNEISLSGKSVLDIGSGPGVWAALYLEHGAKKVHGTDIAERMVQKAKQRYSPKIEFSVSNGINFSQFKDKSFDIVTASFVLHGMKQAQREIMLSEMYRISKKHVIINDFFGKTPFFIQFLEFLEKSDYKHFKQNFCKEIKNKFNKVKRIEAALGTSVYFAET